MQLTNKIEFLCCLIPSLLCNKASSVIPSKIQVPGAKTSGRPSGGGQRSSAGLITALRLTKKENSAMQIQRRGTTTCPAAPPHLTSPHHGAEETPITKTGVSREKGLSRHRARPRVCPRHCFLTLNLSVNNTALCLYTLTFLILEPWTGHL